MEDNQSKLAGVLICLDRQEKGRGDLSAIQEIKQTYHCDVISIITLDDLIHYLYQDPSRKDQVSQVEAYRAEYGIK